MKDPWIEEGVLRTGSKRRSWVDQRDRWQGGTSHTRVYFKLDQKRLVLLVQWIKLVKRHACGTIEFMKGAEALENFHTI